MAQLLLAVDFMGRKGVIHRDLKPENILLNSKKQGVYDIRIADFGFATNVLKTDISASSDDEHFVCGTAGYMAPEILEGKPLSLKSDIFSVGVILFNLLTLKNLFAGKNHKEVMINNKQCAYDKQLNMYLRGCSDEA